MNNLNYKTITAALALGIGLLAATSSPAATFNLTASSFVKTITLPGGGTRDVLMWGFALNGGTPTVPGPALTVPAGDTTLTINLTNALPEAVSLVIPNQNGYVRAGAEQTMIADSVGRMRAHSFVKEAAAGGAATYTWNNVTPGTYLYYSGSHSALQVQMGLYGVLSNDVGVNEAYSGVTYGAATTLVFGEIDFRIHDSVANGSYGNAADPAAVKSMISILPDIFLVNGEPYEAGDLVITGSPQLVRLVNACFDERIPVVNGYHLALVAEDGRKYGYPKPENAINLPSLKTRDALISALPGTLKFYDRRFLVKK